MLETIIIREADMQRKIVGSQRHRGIETFQLLQPLHGIDSALRDLIKFIQVLSQRWVMFTKANYPPHP